MRIGRYEVLGELGRGGMGVVFRVRAPGGGEAALKLLVRTDAATFDRFDRERRLLGSLGEEHGFVGLLDAGLGDEGAWLVMPFVPGGTLRKRLQGRPLGVEETVALGLQVARALGAAHERGIVHRDVKPENVIFTADGRPLLADLGLAKHFDPQAKGASLSVRLTGQGAFKGTVGYMAPEQVVGAGAAGPPADVFGLGAVLHECLAGQPAFEAPSVIEVLAKVGSGVVPPLDRQDVPPWLEAIVRRSLAFEPSARFADGAALADALSSREAPVLSRSPGKGGRSPRPIFALLALATAAGGGLAATLISRGRESGPPARAAGTAPSPPPKGASPSSRASQLADLAKQKEDAGDYAAARIDATRAIELDPTNAMAWTLRGLARFNEKDSEGAIADTTRAIELAPGLGMAWACRACSRACKGDLEGTISDATKAIELDPGLIEAWLIRGQALASRKQWDAAALDLTRAIELSPGLGVAWAERGSIRFEKGDLRAAVPDLERSLELDPVGPYSRQARQQLETARRTIRR